MRVLSVVLVLGLVACPAMEPENTGPTRWPTRCRTDIVPFLAPYGLANTRQTVTFHFRANIVCNTTSHEASAEVELRTPSNELVPIESMQTGRVTPWLGEANVFTVSVVTQLPDVSVKLVRATFRIEGEVFTRDVYLVAPPDDVLTLSWADAPQPFSAWWDLGPGERFAFTEIGNIEAAWFHPQGTLTRLLALRPVASTPTLLAAGGSVFDRVNHSQLDLMLPTVVTTAAALGDELYIVSGSSLLRVETDGGLTLIDTFTSPGLYVTRMVGDGDALLLGFENPTLNAFDHVEIRSRAALTTPGTVIGAAGQQLFAGSHHMWMADGETVTAISGDGGLQRLPRPTAGFPLYRIGPPGPTRPAFLLPVKVDSPGPFSDHPVLWLPLVRPDGTLTSAHVAVDSAYVGLNDQTVFMDGVFAPLPTP